MEAAQGRTSGERLAILETRMDSVEKRLDVYEQTVTTMADQVNELHQVTTKRAAFTAGVIAAVSLVWGMALVILEWATDHYRGG